MYVGGYDVTTLNSTISNFKTSWKLISTTKLCKRLFLLKIYKDMPKKRGWSFGLRSHGFKVSWKRLPQDICWHWRWLQDELDCVFFSFGFSKILIVQVSLILALIIFWLERDPAVPADIYLFRHLPTVEPLQKSVKCVQS